MAINGWHAINHSTCLLTVMIINIANSTDDYLKEDHRSYIRNFCSCKKKAFFLFATAKVAYITAMIFLQIILYSAVHIYDFHIPVFIISVLMMVMILMFLPFTWQNVHPTCRFTLTSKSRVTLPLE